MYLDTTKYQEFWSISGKANDHNRIPPEKTVQRKLQLIAYYDQCDRPIMVNQPGFSSEVQFFR
jgi:hypothetical protein